MLTHKLPVVLRLTALPDSSCSSGHASGGFSVPKQRAIIPSREPGGQEMLTQRNLSRVDMPQVGNSYLKSHIFMVSLLTFCPEGTCQVKGQARFHLSLNVFHAWGQLQTREALG